MNELVEAINPSSQLAFRLLALPVVAVFLLRSLHSLVRGKRHRWTSLLSTILWLLAAVAIMMPAITNQVARTLGIGRGADLLIYLVAISFLASFFYFYRKCRRLESDLTQVVRRLAIEDALAREEASPGDVEGETRR